MTRSSESTIKKLFARSRNVCAFPDCSTRIVDPLSETIVGEVCHIKARSPNGPRFDPTQTEEERYAYANLILLCAVHHRVIDDDPAKFTVEQLQDIKEIHERDGDIELSHSDSRLAALLISEYIRTIQRPDITQTVIGNNNVTVAGDQNVYQHPPKVRVVLPRREGAISPAQCRDVHKWIETLAEGTSRISRSQAFAKWWTKFKKRFELTRYEDLHAADFETARNWYQQQRAILSRGLRNTAPDHWRNSRYGAIKEAMKSLGLSNETYYPQLAQRLRLPRPFTSLTQLTKRDLERVYRIALRDAQNAA